MDHLGEYITCLIDDPALLDELKKKPAETLNQARLSKEEKQAMWSGDVSRIKAMIGGRNIPGEVAQVIVGLHDYVEKKAAAG
jgi:hypothetical protein